jgi:hypothetical protein
MIFIKWSFTVVRLVEGVLMMNRLLCSFAVLSLLSSSQFAVAARLQPSVVVGTPAPAAVAPPVVIPVPAPTLVPGAVCCPENSCTAKCCPTPCISYRSKGERRSCLDDKPGVSLNVVVKNPQTGCCVNVPICVPCCCLDEPCIDSRCGLFHRGIVTYDYDCGFRIVFTFDRAGDLLVTYLY